MGIASMLIHATNIYVFITVHAMSTYWMLRRLPLRPWGRGEHSARLWGLPLFWCQAEDQDPCDGACSWPPNYRNYVFLPLFCPLRNPWDPSLWDHQRIVCSTSSLRLGLHPGTRKIETGPRFLLPLFEALTSPWGLPSFVNLCLKSRAVLEEASPLHPFPISPRSVICSDSPTYVIKQWFRLGPCLDFGCCFFFFFNLFLLVGG